MNHPLVSIIVPVYNVERYLARAVDSLLGQTYPHLDIILVDDGSTDRCPQICDNYARRDHRVRVIHKPNGGLSDARNVGLDRARGELLTFLDSDDYLATDAIGRFVRAMAHEGVDAVCCGLNLVDSDGRTYGQMKADANFTASGEDVVRRLLRDVYPYNFAHSKCYRSALFEGVRFPVGRLYEDIATTYRALARARRVSCLAECLYFYERGRAGNISSELHSAKAARSYFCGCLNSREHITFCRAHAPYADMLPTVGRRLATWAKLCLEAAIPLGREAYGGYVRRVQAVVHEAAVPLPLRLRLILRLSGLYFHLYPLVGRHQ